MKAMLGCCGLDCEKCGAYLATINNDDEMRKQTAKLWSEWNNTTIPPPRRSTARAAAPTG